jgi:2-polyprenyl-3-methyl-5-hydroxy-6-metoxy-1,4-benzoquinol methylase
MFKFHKDKEHYFNIQYQISKEYIIPFVASFCDLNKELKVLEIGCAEAGVLKAFLEKGHHCTGIELSPSRIELAKSFLKEDYKKGRVDFITKDIYNIDTKKDLPHLFDLIILKDVIEHIPDQKKFVQQLKSFLNPDGNIFFGFPPWQMPFGGHQQMCDNSLASILPWYHILPKVVYKQALKLFGETKEKIEALMEIKETGISIERFQRIIKREGFRILTKRFYLINPIYKYKFNLKSREQLGFINHSPYLRNFFTTTAFYLIGIK